MAHPKLTDIRTALVDAKDGYDYKCRQAQTALRVVVGDGTGDADDLAAARALAQEFGFVLDVPEPPVPVKKSGRARA